MNDTALRAEITDDPLGRSYSGMSDAQVVVALGTKDRPRNRTSMGGSEVLNAADPEEWDTRTSEQQQVIWNVVHIGTVNPFGMEADLIAGAFSGSGGVTIAALAAARVELISRSTELGLGTVKEGHVQRVRAV